MTAASTIYFRVAFGTSQGFTAFGTGSTYKDLVSAGTATTAWQPGGGRLKVPSGASWMRVDVYAWQSATSTTVY